MSRLKYFVLTTPLLAPPSRMLQEPAPAASGGLDPASIKQPLKDDWVTYSGDYTGRRYSALSEITQGTVKNLTLAWVSRLTGGLPGGGGGGGRGGGRGGGGGA